MNVANDKPKPKTLPRRTWHATLREQIFHQREHNRGLALGGTTSASANDTAASIPPQS